MPLTATAGVQELFTATKSADQPGSFSSTWRATFRGNISVSYPATVIFTQNGNHLTGTFMADTGNSRHLSGDVVGQELRLSMFDGNQAFLFTAKNGPPEPIDITKEYAPNTLFGDFYSGQSGHETWTAVPDPDAKPSRAQPAQPSR